MVSPKETACSRHIRSAPVAGRASEISMAQSSYSERLSNLNVSSAEAFDPRDEEKVKQSIVSTVGFQRVNQHVKGAMVHWIGAVVKQKFQDLVNQAEDETFTI